MYSRPGKITCILKESSVQSMKMKSRGVMPPHNIWSHFNDVWKVSKYGVFSGPFFPHSDWIRRDTKYLSVFSLNAGKYGPEITLYLVTFHAVDRGNRKRCSGVKTQVLFQFWEFLSVLKIAAPCPTCCYNPECWKT